MARKMLVELEPVREHKPRWIEAACLRPAAKVCLRIGGLAQQPEYAFGHAL